MCLGLPDRSTGIPAAAHSADNRRMLYVPEGFAQGYQTLADETEIFYQMSQFYAPEAARGIRYDDPALAIRWPLEPGKLSERDRNWKPFVVERR